MKVSPVAKALLSTTLFLLMLGILTTSPDLIAVSGVPIIFLIVPHYVKVSVVSASIEGGEYVGEEFTTEIVMKAVGFGIVKAMHKLPEHFELIDGSNAVSTFVMGSNIFRIRYKARPMRRGKYELRKVRLEIVHPFMTWKKGDAVEVDLELDVMQKLRRLTKVETVRGIARSPTPDVDVSKIGVPGTDFREIRDYVPGDPMRFVNWKATARRGKLMVNQYEVEGKKAVWIFLDANEYMTYGKSVRNYLECGIEISNALAYYFTSRGHKVGLTIAGNGVMLYPDVGKRQLKRISEELMRLEAGKENLERAFENCKKLIAIYKPLVILITRPEYSNPSRIVSELIKMGIPMQVIALKGAVEGDDFAIGLFEIMRRSSMRGLRRANLIEWDIERPVRKLMLRVIK